MSLKGIDISNWQKGIDLTKIEADFVIVKSSEGIDWADPSFVDLYNKAKKAGKKLGVYHFARPTANNTPEEEADSFLKIIKQVNAVGEAVLVLDWEAENIHDVAWAKRWLDHVYKKTTVKPLFYSYENCVKSYDWSSVANAGYKLWIARYKDNEADYNYDMSNAGTKPNVKYWKDYIMWQWTSSGKLDNYSGRLDCDIFYGDAKDWAALAAIEAKTEVKAKNGWYKKNQKWYYYKMDKVLIGWQKLKWSGGTDWFYFDKTGIMLTGWQKLRWGNEYDWYYFDEKTGAMKHDTVIKAKVKINQSGKGKILWN